MRPCSTRAYDCKQNSHRHAASSHLTRKTTEDSALKIAILIARILLGLLFFVFGLNNILHFLKMAPPTGDAGTYMQILVSHNFMTFVGLLMVIAGLLLLVGRYVPLALVILGPILVNILLYHALLDPKGVINGIIATILELFLIWAYRLSFRGLFDAAPEVS
jgi:putative oxidoreductase